MLRPLKNFKVLIILVMMLGSGCATTLPVEPPICLPERPVYQTLSLWEQRVLFGAHKEAFTKVGTNDVGLKSYIKTLERFINAHDEPLGSCE